MPTSRWLALMTSSLHRIADHCKRYEVTSAEGGPGGCKFAHPTATFVPLRSSCGRCGSVASAQHKLLNMLWLRSISRREMGLLVPKGSRGGRSCGRSPHSKRKCKTLHFMSKICNIPLGQSPAVASHCIARIAAFDHGWTCG